MTDQNRRCGWSRVLVLGLLLVVATARGQALPGLDDFGMLTESPAARHVEVRAVPSHLDVTPGDAFHVALDVRLAPGWVYYSPDPGPLVKGASLDVETGDLSSGEPLWPPDHPKTEQVGAERIVHNVYEDRAILYVPVTVPGNAEAGEYRIRVRLNGQICEDVCLDLSGYGPGGDITASATVRVGEEAIWNPAWTGAYPDGLEHAMSAAELRESHAVSSQAAPSGSMERGTPSYGMWAGLGLALLAGLILNIMPCVLPIIPLRIFSIVDMAGGSRRRFVTLGLAFAAGILVFFVGLAVANLILQAVAGRALNWAEHFQLAGVRIALALLVVVVAANFFGLFTVLVPRKVAEIEARERRGQGHLSSAGMGLMMGILSTPCSFGVLLAAFLWAQGQPAWLGTLGILTIGVGMAAPHALLSAFPGLVEKLPRPGSWMELLKQGMGFLLLPVAVWLISTLTEDSYPFWVVGYAVVLSFCLWAWGRWVRHDASLRRKLAIRLPLVALAVVGGIWMLTPPEPLETEFAPFDPARIDTAREAGRPVLVKFTAAWCTSCKVIDYLVYDRSEVAAQLRDRNVLVMKGDVTNTGSPAGDFLYQGLRGAPPLTVIYPPDPGAAPIRLTGEFGKSDLFEALDAAATAQ